jgi:hypothetical protein
MLAATNRTDAQPIASITYGGVAATEITGSPRLHTASADDSACHFFLANNIPSGAQTVNIDVNTGASSYRGGCVTVTTDNPVPVSLEATAGNDSGSGTNNGGTVTISTRTGLDTVALFLFHTGEAAVGSVSTNVTNLGEYDYGNQTASYDRTDGSGGNVAATVTISSDTWQGFGAAFYENTYIAAAVLTTTPTLPAARIDYTHTAAVLTTTPTLPAAEVQVSGGTTYINAVVLTTTPTLPASRIDKQVLAAALTTTPTLPAASVDIKVTAQAFTVTPSLPAARVDTQVLAAVLTTTPSLPAAQLNRTVAAVALTVTPSLPAAAVVYYYGSWTFDNGTEGSPVITGETHSGTPLDIANTGTDATLTYSTSDIIKGVKAGKATTGGTSALAYAGWNSFGTLSEIYSRSYHSFTTLPSANKIFYRVRGNSPLSISAGVRILPGGTVALIDSGSTARYTSTKAFVAGEEFRIETHFVFSATVGHLEAKLFWGSNINGSTPDETLGNQTDNWNTGPDGREFGFGSLSNSTNETAILDDIALGKTWLGPPVLNANIGYANEGSEALPITTTGGALNIEIGIATEVNQGGGVTVGLTPVGGNAYKFLGSVIDGAGFQNVIIKDTTRGYVWAGSDVAGVSRSLNHGRTWAATNAGLATDAHQRIASVYQSPTNPNILYFMATSTRTAGGAIYFFRSIDDGESWTRLTTTSTGWGPEAGGDVHPRQTGSLILQRTTDSNYILIGTFDGIKRSTNGGSSFTSRTLSGRNVTSIAQDPNADNTIYVTVDGGTNPGVYRVTNAYGPTGSATATQISSAFVTAQECVAVSESGVTMVYVAAGNSGIRKWNNNTSAWTDLTPADMDIATSVWSAIDVERVGSDTRILVGCCNPVADESETAWRESLFRSTNTGSSWDCISLSGNVNETITDSSGPQWWLVEGTDKDFYKLGKSVYDCASIVVDGSYAYSAGRSGIWWTENWLAATPEWYPAVDGLGATIERDVIAHSSNKDYVMVGDADWCIVRTSDGWQTAHRESLSALDDSTVDTAWKLTLDASNNVWAALGDGDTNSRGGLYKATTPFSAPSWTNERGTGFPSNRSVGVAVGQNGSSQEVVLIVSDGDGIYSRVAGGSWSEVFDIPATATANRHVEFAWNGTSQYVWCYYPEYGLLRSNDYGATWSRIWTKLSGTKHTGYLVKDPSANTLFLSAVDGVFKITNAHDGSIDASTGTIAQTEVGAASITSPGALTINSSGDLFVHDRPSSTEMSRLWKSTDDGANWDQITDVTYSQQALTIFALAYAANGDIYAATDGNATTRGQPIGSMLAVTLTTTPTLPAARIDRQIQAAVLTVTPTLPAANVTILINAVVLSTTPTLPAARIDNQILAAALTTTPTLPAATLNYTHTAVVLTTTPTLPAAEVRPSIIAVALQATPSLPAARIDLQILAAVLTTTPSFPAATVNDAGSGNINAVVLETTPTLPAGRIDYTLTAQVLTVTPSLPAAAVTAQLVAVVLTTTPVLPAARIDIAILAAVLTANPTLPAATITGAIAAVFAQAIAYLTIGHQAKASIELNRSTPSVERTVKAEASNG